MLPPFLGFTVSLIVTFLISEPLIRLLHKKSIVRPDAHKPGHPTVAHSGGVILFISTAVSFLLALAVTSEVSTAIKALVIFLSGAICFAVGFIDDVKILKGEIKTVLSVLGILPVLAAGVLTPNIIEWGRPKLPFIGRLRITIIYWLLMPISIAGAANIVNMLDVMNGVVPGTSIVAFTALAIASLILGRDAAFTISLIMLGALIAYYKYNAYPARVFNGDSGSLFLGAVIGAIAVVEHLEFIALTLLLPHLLNGFFILVSFRGFKEHRQVKKRPIHVDERGVLTASRDPDAPLSLTRLILTIGGPATEPEVARVYIWIESVAAGLAIISAILMR